MNRLHDPATGKFISKDSARARELINSAWQTPEQQSLVRKWLPWVILVSYVAICFLAGAVGGLLGSRIGLN